MSSIHARIADVLRNHPPQRWDGEPYTYEEIADALLSLPGIAIVDTEQARALIVEELNAKYRDGTITEADEFAAMKVNRLLDSVLAAANAAGSKPAGRRFHGVSDTNQG